jgi:riboflavin synthase
MFTGIIEATGTVRGIRKEGSNLRMTIECPFTNELRIDQSISHNGVCLTVVDIAGSVYEVVAIEETLRRSNLGKMKEGVGINLERCTRLGDRLDGHLVQGHVDTVATLMSLTDTNGSWLMRFRYDDKNYLTVEKGSICVNGISLTVVDSGDDFFSVAIIPYTYDNTNLKSLHIGDEVNIEFDVIGKYVARILGKKN